MLQLIGWMGSLYLFVKGFEFLANNAYRDQNGRLKNSAMVATSIAWLGAAVFFFAFTMQTSNFPDASVASEPSAVDSDYPEKSAAWHDCVTKAKDAVEAVACEDVE